MLFLGPIPLLDSSVLSLEEDMFYYLRRYDSNVIVISDKFFYKVSTLLRIDKYPMYIDAVDYAYLTLSLYSLAPLLQERNSKWDVFYNYVQQIVEAHSNHPKIKENFETASDDIVFIDSPNYQFKLDIANPYPENYNRRAFQIIAGYHYTIRRMPYKINIYKYKSKTSSFPIVQNMHYKQYNEITYENTKSVQVSDDYVNYYLINSKISNINFLVTVDSYRKFNESLLDHGLVKNLISFNQCFTESVDYDYYSIHIQRSPNTTIKYYDNAINKRHSFEFVKVTIDKIIFDKVSLSSLVELKYIITDKNQNATKILEANEMKYQYHGNVFYSYIEVENGYNRIVSGYNLYVKVIAELPKDQIWMHYYILILSKVHQQNFYRFFAIDRRIEPLSKNQTSHIIKEFLTSAVLDKNTKVIRNVKYSGEKNEYIIIY